MQQIKTRKQLKWTAAAIVVLTVLMLLGCWVKDINTPYYTQTTSYYCGAASAQMILNSQKLGIYVASQDTIYNYIHSHNQCTGWYSDPTGLSDVLNHYANPKAYFVVSALSNQDDGVKKLAYTIDEYGVPPTSLIYGCAHWVVVRGVITDKQPTTVSTYTINGFFVNDPWYGSTSLGENKYIDIAHWKSDYFTGCSWCGAAGSAYISVVDPKPVPAVTVKYPTVLPRRPSVLSSSEAQERAEEAIKQFETQSEFHKQFGEALEVMKASKITTPLLVDRSDKQKEAYYIVPLEQEGKTSGAILIDAYSGQFQEATYVKKPLEYTSKLQPEAATDLFRRNLPNLKVRPELIKELGIKPAGRSSLINEAEAVEGEKPGMKTFRELKIKPADVRIVRMELVWEPSAETQNPYYPLWKASGTVRESKAVKLIGYMDFKGSMIADITKIERVKMKGGK